MRLNTVIALAALALCALAGPTLAQQQPAAAVNNQDEQVNVNMPVEPGANTLTILRSSDKMEVNGYVSAVVPLEHGVAYEILPHVIKAVTLEKGAARTLKYTPPGGGPARYYIQVVTTARQMPSVIETIHALDLPDMKSSAGDVRYAIRMRYRKASEVATILQNTQLSSDGKVYADDVTNTLFILDSVSDGEGDLAYVDFYDVPAPQVEFDVQIIEVRDEDTDKLGLDWAAWTRSLGGQLTISNNWFEGGQSYHRIDGLLTLDARVLAEFLNYAAQRGHANITRRAKIAANNLTSGTMIISRRVPNVAYRERSQSSGIDGGAVLYEKNPEVDGAGEGPNRGSYDRILAVEPPAKWELADLGTDTEGIAITVTPTIGTDMATARFTISANTMTGFDQLDRPIITQESFDNTVTLQDKRPVRIATLEVEREVRARRGIPGLRDIPYIRPLFSVESTRTERSHLHVIVTPVFCNWRVFEARVKGAEGAILKITDSHLPEPIRSQMLPIEE